MEVLLEILDWVNKSSAPNWQFKYSRCKICGHAWWDDKEEHNFNCWVPRLKKAAEHSLHTDAGDSAAPSELILASAKAASQNLSTPTQRG